MSKTFNDIRAINVADKVEKKEGLTYLSWAWAWDVFKQNYPDAIYRYRENQNGLPYFESEAGAMVFTSVTAGGITHDMWLPVMDSKNKAMKSKPYTYQVWDSYKRQKVEKSVEAFTMFDVNKTLMRCLVKNLAMFGLGLYIYAGEDLPSDEEPQKNEHAPKNMQPTDEEAGVGFIGIDGTYRIPYGSHKGRTIAAMFEIVGKKKLEEAIIKHEDMIKLNKVYAGATQDQMLTFINEATDFIVQYENQDSEFNKFAGK